MPDYSRRMVLKAAAAFAASPLLLHARMAHAAAAYNFVRIEGLAEQAVGEVILKDLYERAGLDISITAMPGRRALQEASSGQKDGETLRVFALGENKPSLIRLPTPLSSLKTVGFVKNGANVSVHRKDDLAGYKNIVVKGVLHTAAITEGLDNVQSANDASLMFKMLKAGRGDIALTSGFDGQAWIQRLGYGDTFTMLQPALNDQPLFHYVHESKRSVLDVIAPIAAEMATSGELAAVRGAAEKAYLDAL